MTEHREDATKPAGFEGDIVSRSMARASSAGRLAVAALHELRQLPSRRSLARDIAARSRVTEGAPSSSPFFAMICAEIVFVCID